MHQAIISPVEEHSKKPDETRKRIVELLGDIPRVGTICKTKSKMVAGFVGNEVKMRY